MDATIKPKYKLVFYLGFYKYSQIFCLGVDIYLFIYCASGKVINANTRMPATKAQSQGIDGILARTEEEKKISIASPCKFPWFGVYFASVNIHRVCQKARRLENLLIKPWLCFEETCTGIWFSRCSSVALLLKYKQAPKF